MLSTDLALVEDPGFKVWAEKYYKGIFQLHGAIKFEKKCNFKTAKKHYLHLQKWQKNQFLRQKKV